MRQIKISSVQYEMLVALGKRWRIKPEELIAELIEENYKSKTKRWKHLPPAGISMPVYTDAFDAKLSFSVYAKTPKNILTPTSHT